MKNTSEKILKDVYDALTGVASEMGPEAFDHFYKGGGAKMFKDIEQVLTDECGITFVDPKYKAVPMTGKKWAGCWMIVDQTGAMVLTGLKSKEDAERCIKTIAE